ncbi:MAG TPA: hypothetical protein VGC56_12025 [Allosphingosinicella sp.]|jgi:hypothetical protein
MRDRDGLGGLPVREAFISATAGGFEVRFGPYSPERVGAFLKRLVEEHDGEYTFVVTLACDPIDDPVPHLREFTCQVESLATDPPVGSEKSH